MWIYWVITAIPCALVGILSAQLVFSKNDCSWCGHMDHLHDDRDGCLAAVRDDGRGGCGCRADHQDYMRIWSPQEAGRV